MFKVPVRTWSRHMPQASFPMLQVPTWQVETAGALEIPSKVSLHLVEMFYQIDMNLGIKPLIVWGKKKKNHEWFGERGEKNHIACCSANTATKSPS